jgi:hypothetical protein
MKGKRRRHDPEFKARVALEALKGIKTIQQIANAGRENPSIRFKMRVFIFLRTVVLVSPPGDMGRGFSTGKAPQNVWGCQSASGMAGML